MIYNFIVFSMLLYKIYIVISSNITKNLTSAKLSTSNFQHEQKDVSCTATQQRINTKLGWDKKNCAEELRVIKLSMKNLKCLASFIFSLYIFCFLIPSFLSTLSFPYPSHLYLCLIVSAKYYNRGENHKKAIQSTYKMIRDLKRKIYKNIVYASYFICGSLSMSLCLKMCCSMFVISS